MHSRIEREFEFREIRDMRMPAISALHFCPSQISLVLLLLPSVPFSPEVLMMRPSFSSVAVGYQRP